MNIFKKYFFY